MIYSRIDVSLQDRAAAFKKAVWRGSTRNIVYFYDRPDASTFRYRGYNICQAMEGSAKVSAHFFFSSEIPYVRAHLREADAFVFIRMQWTPQLESLASEMHAQGKQVHFDVDDLVFDNRYLTLLMNTLSFNMEEDEAGLNRFFAYIARIDKAASLCDGFLCTNEFLAARLEESYARPVRLIPNTLNQEQSQISAQLVSQPRVQSGRFVVAYFSGTPSHDNDFIEIAADLLQFFRRRPEAYLAVVGFLNLPASFDQLQSEGRVKTEPLKDYVELQRSIWAADVNVVPLMVNDFTHCKSALKYFEAAIVGVPTIASKTFNYCAAIRHGQNGFLCEQGEWADSLDAVFEGRAIDPKLLIEESRQKYLNSNLKTEIEAQLLAL